MCAIKRASKLHDIANYALSVADVALTERASGSEALRR